MIVKKHVMQIDLQSCGFQLTDALKHHAIRRLRYSLSHYESHILKVSVRLSDTNGPRHGVDKCCHLYIVMPGSSDVVVQDTEADLYVAIDRATGRAGRTIARQLSRIRESRRDMLPNPIAQLEA